MTDFKLGESPRLSASFAVDGVPTDPTTVVLTIEGPGHVVTVYTWPTTPGPIVHGATGAFLAIMDGLGVGYYAYRFVSTGVAVGANEGDFTIRSAIPSLGYTYDPSTPVGKVRLYTDDRDMSAASASLLPEQRSVIFADDEIQVFLDDSGGDVFRAAAVAMRAIAANRSLFVQRRRIGRTEVDYAELRRDLLKQADVFDARSSQTPADGFAEVAYDDFTLRRIIINEQLRKDNPG